MKLLVAACVLAALAAAPAMMPQEAEAAVGFDGSEATILEGIGTGTDLRTSVAISLWDDLGGTVPASDLQFEYSGTAHRHGQSTNHDGTADYTVIIQQDHVNAQLLIIAGQDDILENDESIVVKLLSGTGYTVNSSYNTFTVTIKDRTPQPGKFYVDIPDVTEGENMVVHINAGHGKKVYAELMHCNSGSLPRNMCDGMTAASFDYYKLRGGGGTGAPGNDPAGSDVWFEGTSTGWDRNGDGTYGGYDQDGNADANGDYNANGQREFRPVSYYSTAMFSGVGAGVNYFNTADDGDAADEVIIVAVRPSGLSTEKVHTYIDSRTPADGYFGGNALYKVVIKANTSPNTLDNSPPVLLERIGDRTVDEHSELVINVQATDPDGDDTITYSTNATGLGVEIDEGNGTLTWTPTEQHGPGTHRIEVTVTDFWGETASDLFDVAVREVNSAPDLYVPTQQFEATPGEALFVSMGISDNDWPQNALTLSKNVTFGTLYDPGFGWTPSDGDAGTTHVIRFTLDDGAGGTDHEDVTVTVAPLADSAVDGARQGESQLPSDHPLVKYAALISDIRDTYIADHNDDTKHTKWKRVLKAMGEPQYADYPRDKMTSQDAADLYDTNGWDRWAPVGDAIGYAESYYAPQQQQKEDQQPQQQQQEQQQDQQEEEEEDQQPPPSDHPLVKYAALISDIKDTYIADHNDDTKHTKWKRVLKAMGDTDYADYPRDAMTSERAAELYADNGWQRWEPVSGAISYAERYYGR